MDGLPEQSFGGAMNRSKLLLSLVLAFMLILLASSLFRQGSSGRAETATSPQVTVDQIVASGLDHPALVTYAGDGSARLFILEQPGQIKIVQNGVVLSPSFLDLRAKVSYGGERGLLGLAFHPAYTTNGYFYVNYTRLSDGATVVERYQVSANPNLALPGSAFQILVIPQPYANHNGGHLAFGPDGKLYIGMGDGGSGGDPQNLAQNINSLLGKMLRIDVDSALPYGIPSDNPFVGKAGADEIWALGLRNPWRFSFDRQTGDLWIGDVGQNVWEEVDFQPGGVGGLNYGWRCYEGTHAYNLNPACVGVQTPPVAEYNHSEGQSVTGGFVYRGKRFPALTGYYFYADFSQGKIWSLQKTGSTWSSPLLVLDTPFAISSFGEDQEGEVYITDYYGGTIRFLADALGPDPNLSTSRKTASSRSADVGETITYTITLVNTGGLQVNSVAVVDTVPAGLSYVAGSLYASAGAVDPSGAPTLRWNGPVGLVSPVLITYRAMVTQPASGNRVNQAQVTAAGLSPLTLTSAILVPKTFLNTIAADIFFPGTQPNSLVEPILLPVSCDVCHSAPIYDTWQGSLMGQAGRDPLMWAALEIANRDASNSGEYCLRCHTPKGWLEGYSQPSDGSSLSPADLDTSVGCAVCHRMVEPDPVDGNLDEASAYDQSVRRALGSKPPLDHVGSAMLILDLLDNRRGPFSLGVNFTYHPNKTYQTDYLGRSQTDFVKRSSLCGTCHNVDNPILAWDPARQQYWPNSTGQPAPSFAQGQLFEVETTYTEWLNSQYASTGVFAPQFAGAKPGGMVGACQDCHMPRATGKAADDVLDPLFRDCTTTGCLPVHDFVGGNTWTPQLLLDSRWRLNGLAYQAFLTPVVNRARSMLQRSASLLVSLEGNIATVRVYNQTGHKLPTGYAEGRRMWINLKAYDAAGNLVYESGRYDPSTGVLQPDANLKVYEIKQGITPELAAVLNLPAGESFHFVLNNTVIKDNRIPPRGFSQAALERRGLQPVGATYVPGQYWDDTVYDLSAYPGVVRIFVTLYYQTASKEYVDFLRNNGGTDAVTLGSLWDALKSPPEATATGWAPNHLRYLPELKR
jgi:uncharacterized repeat protein (TIGR01451 family)